MIKVGITDNHPIIREGVKKIVDRTTDLEVIGEAQNRNELLAILEGVGVIVMIDNIVHPDIPKHPSHNQ